MFTENFIKSDKYITFSEFIPEFAVQYVNSLEEFMKDTNPEDNKMNNDFKKVIAKYTWPAGLTSDVFSEVEEIFNNLSIEQISNRKEVFYRILRSENLPVNEKTEWFRMLSGMSDDSVFKLNTIFTTEEIKLKELDEKYEAEDKKRVNRFVNFLKRR